MTKARLTRDKNSRKREEYCLFKKEPTLNDDGRWDHDDVKEPTMEGISESNMIALDLPILKKGTKRHITITVGPQ